MQWQNRAHFFAVSAQLMRRILVEHARRHNLKRGGQVPHVSLEDTVIVGGDRDADLVSLDDAMNTLAQFDARKAQVVEMRFFGGLSVEETAEVLKVSSVTVMRDWSTAKAWLYRELAGEATMDSDRWKQVDSLLSIGCWIVPLKSWTATLRHACASDEALEREVRSLLAARKRAGTSWRAPPLRRRRVSLPDSKAETRKKAAISWSAGPCPVTASRRSWAAGGWE